MSKLAKQNQELVSQLSETRTDLKNKQDEYAGLEETLKRDRRRLHQDLQNLRQAQEDEKKTEQDRVL